MGFKSLQIDQKIEEKSKLNFHEVENFHESRIHNLILAILSIF